MKINTIVVDFDNTICKDVIDYKNSITLGTANKKLIKQLNDAYNKGFKINIITSCGHLSTNSREEAEIKYKNIIEEFLKKYGCKYDLLSFNNYPIMFYIDDKSIRSSEAVLLNYLEIIH